MARRWMHFAATLFMFWLLVIIYMGLTMVQSPPDSEAQVNLKRAISQLNSMKEQNAELKKMVQDVRQLRIGANKNSDAENPNENALKNVAPLPNLELANTGADGPGEKHEMLRRKIDNGVTELWYYLRSKLKHIKKVAAGNPQVIQTIDNVLEDGGEQERSIITDILELGKTDGAEAWKEKEAKELSDIVQRRLRYLQNPKDCRTAKKVVCNLNKGCGYGCQVHHLIYCFTIAYGTGRTLILESKGWRYNPKGWEDVFQPLSTTCLDSQGTSHGTWGAPEAIENIQVVTLPIIDSLRPRSNYLPLAIPEDLAPRIIRLHGDPAVWWIGQLVKYLFRPQPSLQERLDIAAEKLGFKTPIVGVQVRRTDKINTEAAFHGIEEYMPHVEEYYQLLERRQEVDKRRVYLATDDPSVIEDARKNYPQYEFIADPNIAQTAGVGTRYSTASLLGVIIDIHFLSRSNFLVCTFSSQVCRVGYEIMQNLHPDASAYFRSLDDIYYFGGQQGHEETAVYEHRPRDGSEIAMRPGESIGIAGNHWDGYSKGKNRDSGGRAGLYPSYKTVNKLRIVKMPTYHEADLET